MTIVLDSTILIDHLRRHDKALKAVDAAMEHERIAGSVLTRSELLAGMRSSERRATLALFSLVNWIPVSVEIADRAGRLAREYRRSHQGVQIVDFVIAATAEELKASLWTRNVKHFPMFAGLTPPY